VLIENTRKKLELRRNEPIPRRKYTYKGFPNSSTRGTTGAAEKLSPGTVTFSEGRGCSVIFPSVPAAGGTQPSKSSKGELFFILRWPNNTLKMINSFSDYLEVQMIVLNLKLSFVLTAISFILLSATSFQHQLTSASQASFSNQSYGSNAVNGPPPLLPNVSLQNSTSPNLSTGDLTQKQALIMSHIQRHQPGIIQPQPNQPLPLSQQQPQQQLPNQFQPQPQPQSPMQQQQGVLPEGMRPILLDNIKQSPTVLSTLDLNEKLTLVVQTYNYCGNHSGGTLSGQDGAKCTQFLSLLDQTLINMLSLQ
jgi:hypothetical protein